MADGEVTVGVSLDTEKAEAEAKPAGEKVGKKFEQGVSDEAEKIKKTLPKTTKEAGEEAKAKARKAGEEAGNAFAQRMKDSAKSELGGFGAAVVGAIGVGAAIDGAFSSVEVANEFSEDMGKLNVAFESSGHSAETAASVYRDFVGILGETDQSVEAANHLAELTDSTDDLQKWTTIAAGVYAKFGDSLPLEGLTEAANETAKVGQVTGPLADALNWAGIAEDDFNAKLSKLATEEERAAYITEALSDVYKDAGDAYLETNGALVEYRQSQSDLNASIAGIGDILMPLIARISEMASELLDNLGPAVQFVVDNFDTLISIVSGVVAGFVALKATLAIQAAFTALSGAISAAGGASAAAAGAMAALNAAMKANPAAIIITLVATLVTALVTLFATNEEFRAKVIEVWEAVKTAAANVWGAIVEFFTVTVPAAIQSLVDWFATLPERVGEFLNTTKERVSEFAQNLKDKAIQAGQDFFNGIVDTVQGLPDRMLEIGSNIVSGIWNGIMNAKDWLLGKLGGFADSIVGGIQTLFGINSPSTVMRDQVGRYLAEGVGVGFEENYPTKDIEKSLLSDVTSIGMSARMAYAGNTTTNYFTIERIDAHDLAGVNNVNALVELFNMNA